MLNGMKIGAIAPNMTVLSKIVKEADKKDSNGNKTGEKVTYYNLLLKSPDGEYGQVGCTLDVYDKVQNDKTYDFGFSVNTVYDRIYIRFDEVYETGSTKK